MKYLFCFLFTCCSAMDDKDVIMVCHPIKLAHHERCRSFPLGSQEYFHTRNPELTLDIPQEQIQTITNEDKQSKGKCCTPTRCVVTGSICTAIAGVMTAIVTATVTLVVHFTTK